VVAKPTAILVHNPTAGLRYPEKDQLVAMLADAGFKVKYRSAKRPDIAAKLAKNHGDLIIAAGGDGTIAKVAKILLGQPDQGAPMAILPLGTANNIALSLGISGPTEELIKRLDQEKPRKLSHGICRAHWGEQNFIEGVGLGSLAHATTPRSTVTKDKSTRIHEGRVAFRDAVKQAKPERLYVTVDGERIEDEVILIEILNIRQVGPRLRLAPKADAGDDVLDVAFVATEHRQKLIDWLDALIGGEVDDETAGPPPCANVSGKKITIAWNGMELRLDDKFPLMPGQMLAESPAEKAERLLPEPNKATRKKIKTEEDAAEDEKKWRATLLKADLLNIEIAERKLTIIAPHIAKAKGQDKPKAKRA
jgi:diacylglycerol kinase family enzyme